MVIIGPKSAVTLDAALAWTQNWLKTKEEEDTERVYVSYLFDSRDSSLRMVFSEQAMEGNGLDVGLFDIAKPLDDLPVSKNDFHIVTDAGIAAFKAHDRDNQEFYEKRLHGT